jgi:hypothetical protein
MGLNSIVLQGHTDIDLELDVDPHPASSFSEINHEEVLIPLNYDTLKIEDEVGCVFFKLFKSVPAIKLMKLTRQFPETCHSPIWFRGLLCTVGFSYYKVIQSPMVKL